MFCFTLKKSSSTTAKWIATGKLFKWKQRIFSFTSVWKKRKITTSYCIDKKLKRNKMQHIILEASTRAASWARELSDGIPMMLASTDNRAMYSRAGILGLRIVAKRKKEKSCSFEAENSKNRIFASLQNVQDRPAKSSSSLDRFSKGVGRATDWETLLANEAIIIGFWRGDDFPVDEVFRLVLDWSALSRDRPMSFLISISCIADSCFPTFLRSLREFLRSEFPFIRETWNWRIQLPLMCQKPV